MGLLTTGQLAAAGLHSSNVSKWVRRGLLHRIHRGVYAYGHRALSAEAQALAAVLAAGEGAGLGYLSAVALYRCWRRRVTGIDVVAPTRRKLKGVRVHECRSLDQREITTYRGIPVTTMPRTLVDLGEVLTPHQLANVLHEAAFRELLNLDEVVRALDRSNGRRGTGTLNDAIDLHRSGSAGTRSDLEDTCLTLVEQLELPMPLVNTRFHDIEVDLRWPDANVCVEIDGPGHSRPRTQRQDAERDSKLTDLGQTVLRFDDRTLAGDLTDTGRTLARAVRAGTHA